MTETSEFLNAGELPHRLAKFINGWPLYSPLRLRFEPPLPSTPEMPTTILRDCTHCAATPTWYVHDPAGSGQRDKAYVGVGHVVAYTCSHCRSESVRVWFGLSEDRARNPDGTLGGRTGLVLRKFGQWPAMTIHPPKEVEAGLPDQAKELFNKALTSLSHGFGLGALAYFRRVVEDAISELLDLFATKAEAEGDSTAAANIRAAKASPRMEDRLKVASDALPASLRPGGVNPLAALYREYSRGLHGLSEEECLRVAQQLYFVLEYIFRNWRLQMEDAERFRSIVQRGTEPGAAR